MRHAICRNRGSVGSELALLAAVIVVSTLVLVESH